MEQFLIGIPKAEIHLHIEGTFEPELMFEIGKRNGIPSKYDSIEILKSAYNFNNLQEFLDIYYEGAGVLIHEIDFYEMTKAYLEKIHSQNVVYTEIFFDPQTHTERGIPFEIAFKGIHDAMEYGKNTLGIDYKIIMCFLRHLDEESAFKTLEESLKFKEYIIGVGLDSSEKGNPPTKFKNVFAKAKQYGYLTVAHAGEEGPAEYIWEALNDLNVDRIDHGNNCLQDNSLVDELIKRKMPLTLCPLSNIYLKVVKDMSLHPIKKMLDLGLNVSINSDDPAYFGGYMYENYLAVAKSLQLSRKDIYELTRNSFLSTFLDEESKSKYLKKLDEFYAEWK
jgi:adenine deaminase